MSLPTTTIRCPGCGAPNELANRFVKVVVCPYCEHVVALTRGEPEDHGKAAALSDFASLLAVGTEGSIAGEPFAVLGRVRFGYDGGYWDEWYVRLGDGRFAWLHEDEGELTLVEERPLAERPDPAAFRVGARRPVGDLEVYVTERGEGRVQGISGQVPVGVLVGQQFAYVDGTASDCVVMLEFLGDEVELTVGRQLDPDDIEVQDMWG